MANRFLDQYAAFFVTGRPVGAESDNVSLILGLSRIEAKGFNGMRQVLERYARELGHGADHRSGFGS